jgi:hypothetical protein
MPTVTVEPKLYKRVELEKQGYDPVFCYRYPTGVCVTGNGGVRSLQDNVASFDTNGNPIERNGCDC